MYKRITTAILLGACLLAVGIQAGEAQVKGATAVAETLEEGQTIVGARVEYPAKVTAKDVNLSTFIVGGFNVIATYVNDDGVWNHAEPQGRYVFLKFGVPQIPGYAEAKTLLYFDNANRRQKTRLDLRQTKHLTLDDQSVAAPAAFGNADEINLLVDDFIPVSFTDSAGFEVNYRLYIPKGYETKKDDLKNLPLVFYLHGNGEGGVGNDVQLMGNPSALEFAKPEAQAKHPCFVMAPQSKFFTHTGGSWANNLGSATNPNFGAGKSLAAALEALATVIGKYNVDTSRLYSTGLSAGARGILIANILNPDLFASMICIASVDTYTDEQAKNIVAKPIWVILSSDEIDERLINTAKVVDQLETLGAKVNRRLGDEAVNGLARGYAANLAAKAQWDAALSQNANVLYTHLVAGTVRPSPHWSWMYTYNNETMRDWLFSHTNPKPYQPK